MMQTPMSFKQFCAELNGNRVEGELIKTMLYSLLASAAILVLLYFFSFRFEEDFMAKKGFFLFFAAVSYALLVPTIRQVRAYKEFPCMTGMMLGMTTGMVAGFLSGFYVGATNGMFYGSVFGMIVGIVFGIWIGKCCGVMGFMEGIMAGFMGGVMGAMTAVMLLNDHLSIATGIIFFVCTLILISLNYLIYYEMKETERQIQEDHFLTIILTCVLIFATTWIMVWGPRSGLFG
ncbi:MAG: hypothetical protein AABW64_03005 [Nanoarchaeota archaeon]